MKRLTSLLAATAAFSTAADLPPTKVTFETTHLTPTFFGEGATIADFDKDGHPDAASGPYLYHGPSFEEKTEIYPPKPFEPKGYSDNFLTFNDDIDGDGWTDVFVFGWPGKELYWFQNPQNKEGHWQRHFVVDVADNESPHFADITGDGQKEVVCSRNGTFTILSPTADPTKPWDIYEISDPEATGGKYTHGLGIGDVNGDGRLDIIDKDNWWEHPASLTDKPKWTRHRYQFAGRGGSQMYAYDFDGDGDNDILTSLNGHGWGLAWFEQTKRDDGTNTFKRHLIMGETEEPNEHGVAFSQTHAIELTDIDGDGVRDIVTGKRYWAHGGKDPGGDMPAVLYWFKTVPGKASGKAQFLPYQIHADSGVGTQFDTGDLNGDAKPDILVGNKKGTFIHLQK